MDYPTTQIETNAKHMASFTEGTEGRATHIKYSATHLETTYTQQLGSAAVIERSNTHVVSYSAPSDSNCTHLDYSAYDLARCFDLYQLKPNFY